MKARLSNYIRGWLPKESNITHSAKTTMPRWRRPKWLVLSMIVVVCLAFVAYSGVQTYIRYSNPQADLTSCYFEKTLNCTQATIGDVIEVNVLVGWHGHIFPEFKRQVQIVDVCPDNFELISGSTTRGYSGYGGSDQFQYFLKVTGGAGTVMLPEPKLYLDNTNVSLSGKQPSIQIQVIG